MNSKRLIFKIEDNFSLLLKRYYGKKITSQIELNIIPYNYIEHNTILETEDINISKEILRYEIIKKLIKIFTDTIRTFKIKNLGLIFKYNKLEDYVHKWCWLQYDNNDKKQDSVIPYLENENYNFNEFIEDFNYLMRKNNGKLDLEDNGIKQLIENVKLFLKKSYLDLINTKYIDLKLEKIRDEENVILKCINSMNKEYKVVLNNDLYFRLYKKCTSVSNIDKYIFCLVFRYSYIDAENQQLAIHKKIKEMFRVYNVNFELYGSAINVLSDNYCSLFYDIEKFFGSKGNFFDIELMSGIYWCNPPYIENLMTKTAYKLIDIMNNDQNNNIAFIVTIPIWDAETKAIKFTEITRNYSESNDSSIIARINFNDYPIYALLKPYIKDELIIPKGRIPYFNYRHNKHIFASDTYMLIVYKQIQYKDFHRVFDKIIELDKTDFFILQ